MTADKPGAIESTEAIESPASVWVAFDGNTHEFVFVTQSDCEEFCAEFPDEPMRSVRYSLANEAHDAAVRLALLAELELEADGCYHAAEGGDYRQMIEELRAKHSAAKGDD